MKLSNLLPAALAALTISGFAATANAAATNDGDHATRAAHSSNGKDVFVRLVKVPNSANAAENRDCPMMRDHAAMRGCDRMMGNHHDATPTPQG